MGEYDPPPARKRLQIVRCASCTMLVHFQLLLVLVGVAAGGSGITLQVLASGVAITSMTEEVAVLV